MPDWPVWCGDNCWHPNLAHALPQLAVLAPAPVIARERGERPILLGLAGQAEAHPREGRPASFRDLAAAPGTVGQRSSLRQPLLRAADPVPDGRVDLVLYRAVARP